MRQRFPKAVRLTHGSEFARLKREGSTTAGKLMVFSVLLDGDESLARLGLITSRRVGGAVVRNRIRRRLREIFRARQSTLRPGVWLVIIVRQRAAVASFAALEAEWRQLAARAKILQDSCSS
jgi:ribonuclease P protein component